MPVDPTLELGRTTYAEIYRQIAITFRESGNVDERRAQLRELLPHVEYDVLGDIPDLRLLAVQLSPAADVPEALARLNEPRARRFVVIAEQNRVLRASQVAPIVDDPLYWDQWALGRIHAEPAWQHARATLDPAAPGVVVAIVDSGIQTGHPDLAGHLWDDGAGNHGHDFLSMTSDVSDTYGHGTLLAGTIGATSNDATGIAAAEWPVQLMAVKFFDIRMPPTALSGAAALWWAAANEAKVIVAAWGVGIPFLALQNAIEYAGSKDALVVTAAGNDGLNNDVLPMFPANYGAPPYDLPNVISVMASDFVPIRAGTVYDDTAWFSNFGVTTVHLAAPGVGVLSTRSYNGTTPRWGAYSGTSAACAHVAYAAALLKALNPPWKAGDLRAQLIASADPSPWLSCVAKGRLNLDRAACGPFVITSPRAGDEWQAGADVEVRWNNRYDAPRATTVRLLLSRDSEPFHPIASRHANDGACTVSAPNAAVARARLRIQSEDGPGLYADSGVFSVRR